MSRRARGPGGQASVELVAMMPVVAIVLLALLQVMAAGVARAMAGHAAGVGAVALAEHDDAKQAVRDALPGWARDDLTVHVTRHVVTVRVTPPSLFPGLGDRLASTAHADAGAHP